jgi:DNA-binding NarL/FixJ family response regulator
MIAVGEERPLRLLVVVPQGLDREGLVRILADAPEFEITGVASSVREIGGLARAGTPDVVLLDLDPVMRDAALIEETATWRATQPRVRVVGLHGAFETVTRRRAIAIGIDYLVDRNSSPETVITAVGEAFKGATGSRVSNVTGAPVLTPRERAVLELIALGHTSREVASLLSVSPRTVENHKQRIFSKLGVQNQAQAVAVATRLGLLGGKESGR